MKQSLCFLLIFIAGTFPLSANTPEDIEWFESRIRPILAQECYECHSEATKSKGGLLLDSRVGWEKGGDSGAIIIPGKPEESLLLQSIRHEIDDLKMPKAGVKLDENIVSDFEVWIAKGAPDPRDEPPSSEQLKEDTNWEAVRERRKGWWSFQPIVRPEIPEIDGVDHPVDRFIREKIDAEELTAVGPADPEALHRRLNFSLIGLPPTPDESEMFLRDWSSDPDKAIKALISNLLDNPGFGERWARHWMDWMRYAESHGSEGDPLIPFSWQYRDYLIRALNADVPYDQLLTEHIAGDLLDEPRINAGLALNESAIGPAHFRMVFHGFAPTDALDERVRFTDDKINTVTKAFMGLTVSCARCHDHKFDAISQADYYALFGIFTAALPATIAIDAPGALERNRNRLASVKGELRSSLAEYWLEEVEQFPAKLNTELNGDSGGFYSFLNDLREAEQEGKSIAAVWEKRGDQLSEKFEEVAKRRSEGTIENRWDMTSAKVLETWTFLGEGQSEAPVSAAGDFLIGEKEVISQILPSGTYSSSLSSKHRGFLASAPHYLDDEYTLYLNVAGEDASARFSVQHYPRRGTVYPITALQKGEWQWVKYDRIDYWKGDEIHLELTTSKEAPIRVGTNDRSWFGIREAVLVKKGSPSPASPVEEWMEPLFGEVSPDSYRSALVRVKEVIGGVLQKWSESKRLSDREALLLNEVVQSKALSNRQDLLPADLQKAVERYRRLEGEVPVPTRAPGLVERAGRDWPLYDRGNHKEPRDLVPRRFLEAIDDTPYETTGSGRLEFAADLLREDNSFTARIIVNRVWHHLFGAGLVASPDNFGRLGEKPSHPELLDFLADRFRKEQNWSIKELIRDLVSTEVWQQSSIPEQRAREADPENRLLSHYSMQRLEAEAIRDSIVALAGSLSEKRYGPPVRNDETRRSIYAMVRRNSLDPLLTTFDFPTPASTVGRRSITNVPAQSLTLLNDPGIIKLAERWAGRMRQDMPEGAADRDRVSFLFRDAFNRLPDEKELAGAESFLAMVDGESRGLSSRLREMRASETELRKERQQIIDPVRAAILRDKKEKLESSGRHAIPKDSGLVARWNFADGLTDVVSGKVAKLHGSAKVDGGALVLDGKGYASTPPLPQDVGERTLEAVVRLDNLNQKGGGVITIQDLRGQSFDSIVFAERKPQRWLAGSNNHARTLDFNAPDEEEALSTPVRITMTYGKDGTITCYRNGERWGQPIRKAELQSFQGGASQLLFGLRHGTGASGNRSLSGQILEASLYGRALQAEEVKAMVSGDFLFVSQREIDEVLSESGRADLQRLENEIEMVKAEVESLIEQGAELPPENRRWIDMCHALFNLKEFIYLR